MRSWPPRWVLGVVLTFTSVAHGARPLWAHDNTQAYGHLTLSDRQAELTLFVRHEDWEQALGARFDANNDQTLDNTELARWASTIETWLDRSVKGMGDGRACRLQASTPVVGVRSNKVYVRS